MPTLELFPSTASTRESKLWMPQRVQFTPDALEETHGQAIYRRVQSLGIPIEELPRNRLNGLRGADELETYNIAKRTLAVVNAPPSALKLQPIPPSADWQFHLAEGCPAHCNYCYLAGSLSGPPVIRAFANLPAILENLKNYEGENATSYEASCYTDPLGIEHLTGSLAETIRYFGTRENARLRFVTKFDAVETLRDLPHGGHTRARFSINAAPISGRFEGGTAKVSQRLQAARVLAQPRAQGGGDYPIGFVVAPIFMMENWRQHYQTLLNEAAAAIDFPCDLTFELITHRFTEKSRDILQGWYPKSALDMDASTREEKRNKFGGRKFVYPRAAMKEMKSWFAGAIAERFPAARILYWT